MSSMKKIALLLLLVAIPGACGEGARSSSGESSAGTEASAGSESATGGAEDAPASDAPDPSASGAEVADSAEGELDAPAGAGPTPGEGDIEGAGTTGQDSQPSEDTERSRLPEALRERFTIADDAPEQHGDRTVPRVIEHVATGTVFVYVPGGSFTFGSDADDPDRFDDERPPRHVRMSGFYVAATETTLEAWRRGGGTAGSAPGDAYPVNGVSWYQARDWCANNGLALPTEAQWEYAASGPRDDLYPWGHDVRVKGRANAAGTNDVDLWSESAPVGSFPEGTSWCGATDLAGNVMEWCRDGWTDDHAEIPEGAVDPVLEPEGDAPAIERLVRGGSYESDALLHLRCAYRNAFLPTLVGGNLGFRAVVTEL